MASLSLRAYAKHRGCSLKAVQKAIQSGRIHTTPEGKIDPEQADTLWVLATDHSKRREPLEPATAPAPSDDPGDDPSDDPGDDPGLPSGRGARGARSEATARAYATARAARESYVARIKQLEYEELAGQLVRTSEVEREVAESVRSCRDAMLLIPNRIAAELAGETDPHKVHVKLMVEITQALEELANVYCERPADSP